MKSYLKFMIIFMGIILIAFSAVFVLSMIGKVDLDCLQIFANKVCQSTLLRIITYVITCILSIMALVAIIYSDTLTKDIKGGIVLPLTIGDVQIAPQTFENIVLNITKKYAGVKTTKVLVKIKETGLTVDLFAYVLQDTIISSISDKLQNDIKETVFKQTTVAVEKVNIRVKGIYSMQETKAE